MDYTTTISKRRRHNKVEYLAHLRYYDVETGARKEKSKSAPTISEAKRRVRELEDEFEIGGQTAVESDLMTFADFVKHCKETRYCEAQFDVEGRKIIGVRGKDTVDSHIKALENSLARRSCERFESPIYAPIESTVCSARTEAVSG
jgi:hypothetical protein